MSDFGPRESLVGWAAGETRTRSTITGGSYLAFVQRSFGAKWQLHLAPGYGGESDPNSAFTSWNRRATIGLQRPVSAQPQCNNVGETMAGEKMAEGQLMNRENESSLFSLTLYFKYTPFS